MFPLMQLLAMKAEETDDSAANGTDISPWVGAIVGDNVGAGVGKKVSPKLVGDFVGEGVGLPVGHAALTAESLVTGGKPMASLGMRTFQTAEIRFGVAAELCAYR